MLSLWSKEHYKSHVTVEIQQPNITGRHYAKFRALITDHPSLTVSALRKASGYSGPVQKIPLYKASQDVAINSNSSTV
jgi:hypothetical protein